MRRAIPAWSNDRELQNDEQWLGAYLRRLASLRENPQLWADGLRYIAFRKLIGAEEAL